MTKSENPRFLGGAAKSAQLERIEPEGLPRLVFAGRSNVGKSSLLNALVQSRVARVSATPGKTREMNVFAWKTHGKEHALIDLPGYGFAQAPVALRKQWGEEITAWLQSDSRIEMVFVLADGRHGLFETDVELTEFLVSYKIPFCVVFTKMDKWKSANQRKNAEKQLSAAATRAGVSRWVFVSAHDKGGVLPLMDVIRNLR